MSRREMTWDHGELRKQAYENLDDAKVFEALWEAMESLQDAGLPIGEKAEALLTERAKIKQGIPKN